MLLRPTPAVMDACAARLAAAAAAMEAGRSQWPGLAGDRSAAAEARQVSRALANARRLLDSSAQFFSGWQRLRGALTGGYRADGSAAEMTAPRRIFVQG